MGIPLVLSMVYVVATVPPEPTAAKRKEQKQTTDGWLPVERAGEERKSMTKQVMLEN